MNPKELQDQLDLLIDRAKGSGLDIRFDGTGTAPTSINVCELASRRSVIAATPNGSNSAWLKWLEAERGDAAALQSGALQDFMRCMSRSESIDLSGAGKIADRGKLETLRILLHELFTTHRDASIAPTPTERRTAFARLKDALAKIEADGTKEGKVRNGLAGKWPVVTGILATVAPDAFPHLRPKVHKPGSPGTARGLLDGLKYEPGTDPGVYQAYLERYDELRPVFAAREDALGVNDMGLFGLSAWIAGYQYVVEGPRLLHDIAQTARLQPTILQGPPGTGKTFLAEGLAKALVDGLPGATDKAIVPLDHFDPASTANVAVVTHLVQFHASYDYEDFVRGFRPVVTGGAAMAFELRDGPFTHMVSLALRHPEVIFLLIVDEINRADLARVLGECIYLLDRRVARGDIEDVLAGKKPGAAALRYRPETPASAAEYAPAAGRLLARLCVPENFVLVGTMNTADRSIAVVDIALRRRFAFYDLKCDTNVVLTVLGNSGSKDLERHAATLVDWLERLNGEAEEPGLITNPRFHLGHAYFLKTSLQELKVSIQRQVVPLLEEYRDERRLRDDDGEVDALLAEMRAFPKVARE